MTVLQLGLAASKPLFDHVGVRGTTALRLICAALLLLAVARPVLRGKTPRQLGSVLVLGAVSGGMTLFFAAAIDRIPLGIAATIDYLGPLTVALIGSRRVRDVLWALAAGGGVALITLTEDHALDGAAGLDPLGLAFAAGAAVCWALYIVLTKAVGSTFEGFQGLAASITVGALVVAPFGLGEAVRGLADAGGDRWLVLLAVAGVAVLFPIVPYLLEMAALRRLSSRTFGILFSLEPAVAALIGFAVLAQALGIWQLAGMALVLAAGVAVSLEEGAEPPAGDGAAAVPPAVPAPERTSG
ncbi:EamA family transporter [Streptomyces sp. NPDC101132]|uniref:EamA family transporter n=1 Tax=Streptomyces sp. NPDC101132 TaxID=3366110 RepID=UPI00380F4A2C